MSYSFPASVFAGLFPKQTPYKITMPRAVWRYRFVNDERGLQVVFDEVHIKDIWEHIRLDDNTILYEGIPFKFHEKYLHYINDRLHNEHTNS